MRWPVLRTLARKEVERLLANRGVLVLGVLLVVFALLLSVFDPGEAATGLGGGSVQHCLVDYWEDGPWVRHLRAHVPPELAKRIRFRPVGEAVTRDDILVYPTGTGAIQLRTLPPDGRGPRYRVCFWHPGADPAGLAPYEHWFWKETRRFFQDQVSEALAASGAPASSGPLPDLDSDPALLWQELHRQFRTQANAALGQIEPAARAAVQVPDLECERSALKGGAFAVRRAVATALVLFALFFACVYLLPSLTCEEKERGILLAQALSPASPVEILAGKLLVYPVIGMGLAALLAGICRPAVLGQPYFWLALASSAAGSLGLGMTIACIARTQRSAGMGAMGYTLAVTMLVLICKENNVPGLPLLALEYHVPRMFEAALDGSILIYHWGHLAGTTLLAGGWLTAATVLFRRGGWQ